MAPFAARVADAATAVELTADGLVSDGQLWAWVDLDHVEVDGHAVHVGTYDGRELRLTHLGAGRDRFVEELRQARSAARRAALLQWGGASPIDTYESRADGALTEVSLFPDAVVVEPRFATPTFVPLALVQSVERDGWTITLRCRAVADVVVKALGQRTDEFVADLDAARSALAGRSRQTWTALDPGLAGLDAPDGWAVTSNEAGTLWPTLRAAVAGQSRAVELDVLTDIAGDDLRLGVKHTPGEPMPFALAVAGTRVAVEATDADDRATFVFEADDVDRLNVALLLTNFRREAISLPEERLGRWALAARTLEVVRWARSALAARVVHDQHWEARVRDALAGGGTR